MKKKIIMTIGIISFVLLILGLFFLVEKKNSTEKDIIDVNKYINKIAVKLKIDKASFNGNGSQYISASEDVIIINTDVDNNVTSVSILMKENDKAKVKAIYETFNANIDFDYIYTQLLSEETKTIEDDKTSNYYIEKKYSYSRYIYNDKVIYFINKIS